MLRKLFLGVFGVLVLGVGSAQAVTINLDGTVNIGLSNFSNYVGVNLAAGKYQINPIDDVFTAFRFGDNPLNCDGNGENCGDGWEWNLRAVDPSDSFLLNYATPTTYATPLQALGVAQADGPFQFEIASAQEVRFGLGDGIGSGGDNDGGVSFTVLAIPLPAALPLFGTGLALLGVAGWRRRRAN